MSSSKWLESEGARQRVTDLLYEAGIPLELEVEEICKGFSDEVNEQHSYHVSSEKIVYASAKEPESYREVDQLVTFYDEFELGSTGIQMVGNVPIECKHRGDIEYFAFPIEQETAHHGFPVWSELGWSQCMDRLRSSYDHLSHLNTVSIAMLQIKNGEQPQSTHKENLHYNGAGALYDFVLFNAEDSFPGSLFEDEDDWIDDTGMTTELQERIGTSPIPLQTLKNYISEVSLEQCRAFNSYAHQDGHVFHMNMFQMPILCVNGPIYHVEWEHSLGITGYTETDACLLQIRKPGWPGLLRNRLLNHVVEVPVVLTNVKGLSKCLENAFSWYQLISRSLSETPEELVERLPLEAALYTKGIEFVEEKQKQRGMSYRSDLDSARRQ